MRLTLRTLLAYMDDILEPADHEDLGKKIEASDFATELIHRSRDTVRRLRLGAPPVLASDSDDVLDEVNLGDANSVAEYLDNMLPPEQVAEFERMCLEQGITPDMHLAEVASCHHVLTMVLGEPADIDVALKARMYKLPAQLASGQKLRIEPRHDAEPAAPPVAPTVAPSAQASPPAQPTAQPASVAEANEVPDYLREAAAAKRSSRRWAIATTLLATCGLVWYWFASAPEAELPKDVAMSDIGTLDEGVIDIQGMEGPSTDAAAGSADPADEPPLFNPDNSTASDVPAAPETDSGDAPPFTAAPVRPEQGTSESEPADEVAASVPAPVTDDLSGAPPEIPSEAIGEMTEDLEGTATASAPPALPTAPDSPESDSPPPGDEATTTDDPLRVASAAGGSMVRDGLPTTDAPEATQLPESPSKPVGPQRIGNYLGNNDLLLIQSGEKWLRLPPRSPISTGDVLMVLPKFRTHVVLADVNAYLSGGTQLRFPVEGFAKTTGDAELNFEIVYGRLLLNAGLKGSRVAIKVGDEIREFSLSSSASLAVEVDRVFVPGKDYENEPAPIEATWYLTSGSVEWPTATGGTQSVEASSMWKTIDGLDEIPERIEQLPTWIDHESMTDMQRSARNDISHELTAGQPVGLRLLELTDGLGLGRRREVRPLAAAASVYVGEFEPLVKALNDSAHSRDWDTQIHELRHAMALSPHVAARVRQAFVNIRGAEAAQDLMEMVVGYSPEQIGETREEVRNGELNKLMKWLDHDSLDYRVLAIHNIQEITGKTKGYRPDQSSKRRKIDLRKLYDEFESNELRPL